MSNCNEYTFDTEIIVHNGAVEDRWNLAIMGDNYQAGNQLNIDFVEDVNNFINHLKIVAPYSQLWCGINIHRIKVPSTANGPYFNHVFNGDLLTCDVTLAWNVADCNVKNTAGDRAWHAIVVIVNSPIYGGSGSKDSQIAVFSQDVDAVYIGVHELQHIFGLSDEYGACCPPDIAPCAPSIYNGAELEEFNVAVSIPRAQTKWGHLIDPTTPLPTMPNPDCTDCNEGSSPVPPGTVGAFESGEYHNCGIYRAEYNCRMRDIFAENFCAICQEIIYQTLSPFVPSPTTVTPTTLSISFTDIPEGRGEVKPIEFQVHNSCVPLTFHIIPDEATGLLVPLGFTLTSSSEIIVPPTTFSTAQFTVGYTATNAGDTAGGSIFVEVVEICETFTIDLTANTVGKPAVVLVLDRSGSMAGLAGDGVPKIDKLRHAAGTFVDLMEAGDGIGIITFNHEASENLAVRDVGADSAPPGSGRANANNLFEPANTELAPGGSTSIGDGVFQGKQSLDAVVPNYGIYAMLVLTDGNENTPLWLDDVGNSITSRTFAVGLGKAADVSTQALNKLTQNTGGYLLITGEIGSDQSLLLDKYFLQILAGITTTEVILDPSGYLLQESQHRIPFSITEAEYSMDVIMISPTPRAIGFYLETPNRQIIDPGQAANADHIKFVSTDRVSFYRLALPPWPNADSETYIGTWHAILLPGNNKYRGKLNTLAAEEIGVTPLPYDVIVHAHSNLKFGATVYQNSLEPEADITIRASLTEYGLPPTNQATVWAEIIQPNGIQTDVSLEEYEAGQFVSTFKVGSVGEYHIQVRARGVTLYGTSFQRELQRTAVSFVGGDEAPTVSLVPDGLQDESAEGSITERLKNWCFYLCLAAFILSMLALLLVIILLLSS